MLSCVVVYNRYVDIGWIGEGKMTFKTVTVSSASHCYDIEIYTHVTNWQARIVPHIAGKQVMIVTNKTVSPLYLDRIRQALDAFNVYVCILADGEQYKNQQSVNQIYDALMQNHCQRDVTLVALGGGVIGDMTGFAAASFMRGVRFIQIPTTLLAQVDSSVGGKTGINHPLGKNMIGAFWQPQAVVADMSMLSTLPKRELSAGLAEVIKYALIMDKDFLSWLEQNMAKLLALDVAVLQYAVKRCCEMKAQIVAQDEKEMGCRALLNFGHTFGHVIETHEGYGNWLHGEAVAVGMVQAAKLSERMGWISQADCDRIAKLMVAAKLPVTPPNIDTKVALDLMQHDKKVQAGKIRLVLLKALGQAVVSQNFNQTDLQAVLNDSEHVIKTSS